MKPVLTLFHSSADCAPERPRGGRTGRLVGVNHNAAAHQFRRRISVVSIVYLVIVDDCIIIVLVPGLDAELVCHSLFLRRELVVSLPDPPTAQVSGACYHP